LKKVAVVDIGSNTVKLFVYKVSKGKIKKVYSESVYLRLLNYVENGKLKREGIEKLKLLLESFKESLREFKPHCVIAVGTYVLRVIDNKDEVLRELSCAFKVKVLSGEEEAYYSALGALLDVKVKEGLLFDIGGGSLEVCQIEEGRPTFCKSYPLGTLEFKEAIKEGKVFQPIKVRWKVRHFVNPYDFKIYKSDVLIGVGGSVRALKKISGKRRIKRKNLEELVKELLKMSPEEISSKFDLPIKRAQTVSVASLVALELMDIFKSKELLISKNGLREGLVYEKVVLNGEC